MDIPSKIFARFFIALLVVAVLPSVSKGSSARLNYLTLPTIRNQVRNPSASASSEKDVATGTEVTSVTNSTTVATIGEDTKIVKNETGSVSRSEDTKKRSEQDIQVTEVAREGKTISSTTKTTKSFVSEKSSVDFVELPEAVNRTGDVIAKQISDAISGALFEATEGGDITIQARKAADIITSAYADMIVAAGSTAESVDKDKICAQVLETVAPEAVTASIRSVLEQSVGDIPVSFAMYCFC